ncbi:hypothetical protein [Flectobacillus rivi]|uniref:Outer membrane protein beta-barrel domain-containing protein n=1 Tax=Flectobacillus rivi TaxID=2984209 RepID=A0ABT6YVN6_9BACT|nr:hypothetical protein [Flectobacillus rivi]MDI9872942.1 hypothetical protein [Flectobacillus rivi]
MKKSITLYLCLWLASIVAYSQNDTIQQGTTNKIIVSGAISATNNGISLVPAFSLEKPATIFDLAVRKNKFSFEPQLAFGLEDAKPWYFVFWLKYKLIESSKFNLGVGVHPGFLFSTSYLNVGGITKEYFTTARFFVGAIAPSYSLSKKVSIGIYYQLSRGYNIDLRQSQFLGINGNFSDLGLGGGLYVKINPQIYYLKNDNLDGFYANTSITLSKKGFPFSISSLLNKKLNSDIPSKNFIWNTTLSYTF